MRRIPAAALGLLVLHLVLSPLLFSVSTLDVFELPKNLLLRACAVALGLWGVAWLLGSAGRRTLLPSLGRALAGDPIRLGVVLLLASAALSTLASRSPLTSWYGDYESFAGLTTQLAHAVVFFATLYLIRGRRTLIALLWAVWTGAAGAAAYALAQRLGLDPIAWSRADWDPARVSGPFGQPNFLGAYLAVALPLGLFLVLRAWRCGERAVALGLAALSLLVAGVVALTLSRGAWLALAIAVVTLAVAWWAVGERSGARAIAVAAGVALIVPGLWMLRSDHAEDTLEKIVPRLERLAHPTREPRFEIWRASVRMLAAHPVLGAGLDTFQVAFPGHQTSRYWELEWGKLPNRAHSEPLQVAATQGLVGLAALAVLASGLVWGVRQAFRRAPRSERALVGGLGAALLAFAVQSLFGFTVVALGVLFATLAAALSRLADPTTASEAEPAALGPGALGACLAGAGLVAAAAFVANGVAASGRAGLAASLGIGVVLLVITASVAVSASRVERAVRRHEGDRASAPREEPGSGAWWLAGLGLGALGLLLLHAWVYRPFLADEYARRGAHLSESGRPHEGVPHLVKALELAPHEPHYWVHLALAQRLAAAGQPHPEARRLLLEGALRSAERAIELVPVDAYHHAEAARALTEMALERIPGVESRDALAAFERALARAPVHAGFLDDAGRAALRLGALDTAERHAQRNLELYPSHAPAHGLLGAVAITRRDWTRAASELATALRSDWHGSVSDEAAAWSNLARVHLERGHPRRALAAAQRALRLEPGQLHALFYQGRAYETLAETKGGTTGRAPTPSPLRARAIESYERILALEPGNEVVRERLRELGAASEPESPSRLQ